MRLFDEILTLLAVAVFAVTLFQRYRLPSSLAYLLVGIIIGPSAFNWITDAEDVRLLSEFGIVFLLFTIGLNFPLPEILAMRNVVAGVGSGQVLLTTALIAAAAWLAGVDPTAAFVMGAAFAQSSTTVISKQLSEQGEEHTRHGRLGTAVSIFQDITTVPFVVVIPVLGLGAANDGSGVAGPLAAALAKATLAFFVMFAFGRKVLRPLFHAVAARHSSELFTLAVLLVSLAAAWITEYMGLSLALGAFFAGVLLAETEFRHQIEITIRPFRDVLLGLFFVSIGMLLDVRGLADVWHWALSLALLLLGVKTLLVAGLVRHAGVPLDEAIRTGLLVAVGGEFGFALAAIGLSAGVLTPAQAQITLTAILISIILAPVLIRYNGAIARRLYRKGGELAAETTESIRLGASPLREHVIICGYGRIGQNIVRFLEREGVEYVALDLDPALVREAHAAGEHVYYGDASEHEMLQAAGIAHARLLVISFDDIGAALKLLHHVRDLRPDLPILVRARDDTQLDALQSAGATEVISETLEAGTMLVSHVLMLLGVPASRVVRRMRDVRRDRYRMLREYYHSQDALFAEPSDHFRERLHTVTLTEDSHAAGLTLDELRLDRERVLVTAINRKGIRGLAPEPGTRLRAGDVVALYGAPEDLDRVQARLLGGK